MEAHVGDTLHGFHSRMDETVLTPAAAVAVGGQAATGLDGVVGRETPPVDEVLMVRVREQDADALAALYDRHHRAAFALALRILNDVGQAEDVVQESFLAVWRHAAGYDPTRGRLRTWLLTIVHHRAINQLRRRPTPGQMAVLDEGLRDSWQPEVWRVAFDNIRQQDIRGALAELPAEQRTAVELAFWAYRWARSRAASGWPSASSNPFWKGTRCSKAGRTRA
jgi:RNA polymerase sigma factor (sigma-70 family)